MSKKMQEGTYYVDSKGKRFDGRALDEIRPVTMKLGVIEQAEGSAFVQWGHNKAIAAVYGPREVLPKHMANPRKAIIRCYYRMAPFSVPEHKNSRPGRRDIEISKVLSEALERAVLTNKFPNSQIEVHVMLLDADAGTRITALTAASLALAAAGIPMRDLVCGVAVGKAGGNVMVDVTKHEEDAPDAVDLPMAVLPNVGEVVLMQMDGPATTKEWKEMYKAGIEAAKKVYEMQKQALKEAYSLEGDAVENGDSQ